MALNWKQLKFKNKLGNVVIIEPKCKKDKRRDPIRADELAYLMSNNFGRYIELAKIKEALKRLARGTGKDEQFFSLFEKLLEIVEEIQ